MTTGQKIKYHLILNMNRAVGLLPSWFLYGPLLHTIYFLLYRIVRYRLDVVRRNLRASFPDKTPAQLREIEKGFYRHLSEIFIDTVDIVSLSAEKAKKRVTFENVEEHEREVAGRDWIAAMGHYGSWEYFSVYQFYTQTQTAGIYRPVKDKALDAFYRYSRSRFGMEPVSMKTLMRYLLEHQSAGGNNIALGMIADQSAHHNGYVLWFDFLNQKTIFYTGIERIARRMSMPVYYTEVKKVGKARYTSRFIKIYDGKEELPEGEITARYAALLEKSILEAPQYWMWSHRRWKHTFGEGSRFYENGTITVMGDGKD